MTQILTHRGPDGNGQVILEGHNGPWAFLGHRRLKVIDLSEAASQPMTNETGTVFVSFNGEIYNHLQLRSTLSANGHRFRSESDTEVLVHGYEEWGERLVDHLDGMFAFAVWDSLAQRLLLARDRVGKKPLYFHFAGRRFSFASEIKGLLVCPWIERSMDESRLGEYLQYGYVGTPRTLFKGIRQLEPASSLTLDRNGLAEPRRYWRLELREDRLRSEEEVLGEIRERVAAAVEKRLLSDVPLGAYLSGGVDSAIVVGLMARALPEPVKTFTIGFSNEPSYDERNLARLTARHFGTSHTEYAVNPNAADLLEKLLWHHDQPYSDSSAIPTYLVAMLAKQQVTVALSGDGGDELFAGYNRFLAALIGSRIPPALRALGSAAGRLLPKGSGYFNLRGRSDRFWNGYREPIEERYRGWMSVFGDAELAAIFHPDLRCELDPDAVNETFRSAFATEAESPLLNRLLKLNFDTYLPDDLLVKADRTSMAHSLEIRSPFLDRDLIDYTAGLPPDLKIKGRNTKYALKKAFAGMVPPKILNQPKHGFGVPTSSWFRKDLGTMFQDLVLDHRSLSARYIDQAEVRRIFSNNLSELEQNGPRLWTLLNLEAWLRSLNLPVQISSPNPQIEVQAVELA